MLQGKRVVAVVPAYNQDAVLRELIGAIPRDAVDEVLLIDDGRADTTVLLSREFQARHVVHPELGGQPEPSYAEALGLDADAVVVVRPGHHYDPGFVTTMASLVTAGVYDLVLATRSTGRSFGMAWLSTTTAHPGCVAFSGKVAGTLPVRLMAGQLVFDQPMLMQADAFGFSIGEVACPPPPAVDRSVRNFRRPSLRSACRALWHRACFRLWRWGVWSAE